MMQNGNYLVPSINGMVDHLNDKPPLFFWSQILFIKLIGYNELAVRIPSAICGALTVILIFSFIAKHFSFSLGLFAALVLCSIKGFVTFHSSRTGDMDVMLTLGITGFVFHFYNYMKERTTKYLIYSLLFFLFAFFTKSIIVFFTIPAIFVWIISKERSILKDKKIWIGILAIIVSIASYIFIRSKYEAGYFGDHMLDYLLRFKQPFYATHDHPWDFYINNFYNDRFAHYFLLLPLALLLSSREKNPELKSFIQFISLIALVFIIILSISPTKCFWYDVPVFPIFAIIIGYLIWKTIGLILEKNKTISIILITGVIFSLPLYYAIKRSHNNDISDVNTRKIEVVSEYFHEHKKSMPYASITVGNEQYETPMLFYKYYFRDYQNKNITVSTVEKLNSNEIFITGNDSIKNYITTHYQTEQLETYKNATIYKIKQ
jgi:4-amino-4-deoxy-L-arabinose transferase-like glycosyltransferase